MFVRNLSVSCVHNYIYVSLRRSIIGIFHVEMVTHFNCYCYLLFDEIITTLSHNDFGRARKLSDFGSESFPVRCSVQRTTTTKNQKKNNDNKLKHCMAVSICFLYI